MQEDNSVADQQLTRVVEFTYYYSSFSHLYCIYFNLGIPQSEQVESSSPTTSERYDHPEFGLTMCPFVSEMLLSAGFSSDSRNYQFVDIQRQVLLVITNKRLNQGYDRYELLIYSLDSLNLLYKTQIDKQYTFLAYDETTKLLIFIQTRHVSSQHLKAAHIDLFQSDQFNLKSCAKILYQQSQSLKDDNSSKQSKVNNSVYATIVSEREELRKLFGEECSGFDRKLPTTEQTVFSYNYLSDEMTQVKYIPVQYIKEQDQEFYYCLIDTLNSKLYCYGESKDLFMINYSMGQGESVKIHLLSDTYFYYLLKYSVSQNDKGGKETKTFGILVDKRTAKVIMKGFELFNQEKFVPHQICSFKQYEFFLSKKLYVCFQQGDGMYLIDMKNNNDPIALNSSEKQEQEEEHNSGDGSGDSESILNHLNETETVQSIRFSKYDRLNKYQKSIIDIQQMSYRHLSDDEVPLFILKSSILTAELCKDPSNGDAIVCIYQIPRTSFFKKQRNKALFLSVPYQQQQLNQQWQQSDKERVVIVQKYLVDENQSNLSIVLSHGNSELFKYEVIVIYMNKDNPIDGFNQRVYSRVTIDLNCSNLSVAVLSWIQEKYSLFIQNACYSLILFVQTNEIVIQESKYESFHQQQLILDKERHLVFTVAQLDRFRSKVKVIDLKNKSTFSQRFLTDFTITSLYLISSLHSHIEREAASFHIFLFSKVGWQLYFLSQNNTIVPTEQKGEFNLENNSKQFIYGSSKQFNSTLVVFCLPIEDSSDKEIEQNQNSIIAFFYILKQNETLSMNQSEKEQISFYATNVIKVEEQFRDCITNSKESYFFDTSTNVIVFYGEQLCVIDASTNQLKLNLKIDFLARVFYHSAISSVFIISQGSASSLIYKRITLPNSLKSFYGNQHNKYSILDANLSKDILQIHLSFLNDKYIYAENIRQTNQNNQASKSQREYIPQTPLYAQPCAIFLGSYKQQAVFDSSIISKLFKLNIDPKVVYYRLIQVYISSLYFFNFKEYIQTSNISITGQFCFQYEGNGVFSDLIDFEIIEIYKWVIHVVFVFSNKVELQQFKIREDLSLDQDMLMSIAFQEEITEVIAIEFKKETNQFLICARSHKELFVYEMPLEMHSDMLVKHPSLFADSSEFLQKEMYPVDFSQMIEDNWSMVANSTRQEKNKQYYYSEGMNAYLHNKQGNIRFSEYNIQKSQGLNKEMTCLIESRRFQKGRDAIESFQAVSFIKSILFPLQFTFLMKIQESNSEEPTFLQLPSLGSDQKASVIITVEQLFQQEQIYNKKTQQIKDKYILLDSKFFDTLTPLQELSMSHFKIDNSIPKTAIQLKKIRKIYLKNIILCPLNHRMESMSIKFSQIDELVIENMTLENCNVIVRQNLFEIQNIDRVILSNIKIQSNNFTSSISQKNFNIFNIHNISNFIITNLTFSHNNLEDIYKSKESTTTAAEDIILCNRLFNIRIISNITLTQLSFTHNQHAIFMGLSAYIHYNPTFNQHLKIKEKNFFFSMFNSSISRNTLPPFYFFFVKNGQILFKNLKIEENISTETDMSELKEEARNHRPKSIFQFLSCSQLQAQKNLYCTQNQQYFDDKMSELTNVVISGNELFQEQNLIVISTIMLQSINNIVITGNIYLKPIILFQNSNSLIMNSVISLNIGSNKPVFVIEQNSFMEFISSSFLNNDCQMCIGSALFISASIAKFQNCSFFNNTALQGGAISVNSCSQWISFEETEFVVNHAQFGGALSFVSCETVSFRQVLFERNSAHIGGAVYYQKMYPQGFFKSVKELEFKNNTASEFGQNIGSLPQSLRVVSVSETVINGRFQEDQRLLNYEVKIDMEQELLIDNKENTSDEFKSIYLLQNRNYDKIIFVENITSGATVTFAFHIFDEEGNRIFKLINSDHTALSNKPRIYTLSQNLMVLNSKQYILDGKLHVEIEVVGNHLSSTQQFQQEEEYITIEYENIQMSSEMNDWKGEAFKQFLYLRFRQCSQGEVQVMYHSSLDKTLLTSAVYKCEECRLGKYSLTQYPDNQTQCTSCMSSAIKQCYGHLIELNQGYWRSDQYSQNILPCDLKENCNGGVSTDPLLACHIGHIGPLCEACDIEGVVWGQKYAASSNHSCTPCQNVEQNTLKIISFVIITFVFIVLIIKSTLKYCQNKIYAKYLAITGILIMGRSASKKVTSIYVKILMSYVQVWQLVRNFGVGYNEIVFGGLNYVASPLEQVLFSGECFVAEVYSGIPVVYLNLLFALATPFLLMLIVLLFYVFLAYLKQITRAKMISYWWTSFFYIFLLFQNKIVTMLLSMFSVRELDGKQYMRANILYPFQKDTFDSQFYSRIVYPSLFFWIVFILFTLFIILFRNRNNLQTVKVTFAFGFLYGEYREQCFYWELLRVSLRTVIAGVCNLLADDPKLSCMLVFLTLSLYQAVLCWKRPFIQRQFNNLEILSTLTSMLTLALALVLFHHKSNKQISFMYKQDEQQLQRVWLSIICQWMITGMNSAFLLFLGLLLLKSLFVKWEFYFYRICGMCIFNRKQTNDLLVLKRWALLRRQLFKSNKFAKKQTYSNKLKKFVEISLLEDCITNRSSDCLRRYKYSPPQFVIEKNSEDDNKYTSKNNDIAIQQEGVKYQDCIPTQLTQQQELFKEELEEKQIEINLMEFDTKKDMQSNTTHILSMQMWSNGEQPSMVCQETEDSFDDTLLLSEIAQMIHSPFLQDKKTINFKDEKKNE